MDRFERTMIKKIENFCLMSQLVVFHGNWYAKPEEVKSW